MPSESSESYVIALEILLTSSWLNAMLYMLEIVFVWRYFTKFSSDRPAHHYLVCMALLFDTISTAAVCANVWLYLITLGTDRQPTSQMWPLPTMIISNVGSSVLEQGFLIYRFWKLRDAGSQLDSPPYHCQTRILNILSTGFLVVLVLTHTIFGLISGIYLSIHPEFAKNLAVTATTVSNCTSAVTDVAIAIAVVWQLHAVKSSFHATQSLIRRLSFNAIASGFCVAACTLLMMILFLKSSSAFNIFFTILGRLYSITILVNLCTRRRRRQTDPNTSQSSVEEPATLDLTSINVQTSLAYSSAANSEVVREDARHVKTQHTTNADSLNPTKHAKGHRLDSLKRGPT